MMLDFISDFRVLIVPGLHNSGARHWQTRWQALHPAFERVEQTDWNQPQLAAWSERLGQSMRRSTQPTLIVAHSFGCLATVRCAGLGAGNVMGALLVAPADPEKFHVSKQLRDAVVPYPSIVIGSTNDPWMDAAGAREWAAEWGSDFVNAGPLGHINAESGLGDWLFGLAQLQRLVETAKKEAGRRHATQQIDRC
ncbi:MAG: RBBP9/YdeN family alpha/beta hydrolase [Burkholderiaceae bacterium]